MIEIKNEYKKEENISLLQRKKSCHLLLKNILCKMAGFITIKIILVLLSFYSKSMIFIRKYFFKILILVNTVSNVVVDTTQFDNFTILWEDFSLLQCATPTTINVSLFSCFPPPSSQIVDDMYCLPETTIDFDQTTCQATSTAVMYTSSAAQTTQQVNNEF